MHTAQNLPIKNNKDKSMSKRSVSNSSKPPTGRRIPLASVSILEEEEHGKLLQFSDDEDRRISH